MFSETLLRNFTQGSLDNQPHKVSKAKLLPWPTGNINLKRFLKDPLLIFAENESDSQVQRVSEKFRSTHITNKILTVKQGSKDFLYKKINFLTFTWSIFFFFFLSRDFLCVSKLLPFYFLLKVLSFTDNFLRPWQEESFPLGLNPSHSEI